MSDEDSGRGGPSRRAFAVILGGLAAGAVLGTTVMAHADDEEETVHGKAAVGSAPERKPPAQRWGVDHRDVASLAAKLDALDLSTNERALLAGLLSVATDVFARSGQGQSASHLVSTGRGPGPFIEVRTPGAMPSVRDQFRAAFTPGAAPPAAAADTTMKNNPQ
jgi:hypothetical protein